MKIWFRNYSADLTWEGLYGDSWFLGQGEIKELRDEWFEHHFPVMMFRNRMMKALSVCYSVGVVESGFISSTSVLVAPSG